jgi:hypothetical protein
MMAVEGRVPTVWRLLLGLVVALGGFAACVPDGSAAGQSVTAAAKCDGTDVRVQVTNRTSDVLHVSFARALVDAADVLAEEFDIPNGVSQPFRMTSSSFGSDRQGGLIVTSVGVLLPRCEGERLTVRPDGEAPALALRSVAVLESLYAYDALYALVHGDEKAVLSYGQMVCWYADFLSGKTTAEATVRDVKYTRWTWGGNGRTYNAAAVTYRQPYWSEGVEQDQDDTEHYVLEDGQWRWFLGDDPGWIAALPSSCAATGAGSVTPSTRTTATAVGTNDVCAWYQGAAQRLDRAATLRQDVADLVSAGDLNQLMVAAPNDATELADLAEAERQSSPPPGEAVLSESLATGYDLLGQGIQQLGLIAYRVTFLYIAPASVEAQASHAFGLIQSGDDWIASAMGDMDRLASRC